MLRKLIRWQRTWMLSSQTISKKTFFWGGGGGFSIFFLFFWEWPHSHTKKWLQECRSRCNHMHISSFTIYRKPTARSVTCAYISTRERNVASCCLQVLWEKRDSMQQRLDQSRQKFKLAFDGLLVQMYLHKTCMQMLKLVIFKAYKWWCSS